MIFRKSEFLCFLLLFLSAFTSSCRNSVDGEAPIDKSFLEKGSCAPPCWYGLELDKSTERDVYAVLKQLPFVDQNSIYQQETAWGKYDHVKVIGYKCLSPKRSSLSQKRSTCGVIEIAEDKVKTITIGINYDLRLFRVVEELGVVQVRLEVADHVVGVVFDLDFQVANESLGGRHHRREPAFCCDPCVARFESVLGIVE